MFQIFPYSTVTYIDIYNLSYNALLSKSWNKLTDHFTWLKFMGLIKKNPISC